jgi:serine/threonine protein kinase
MYLQRRHAKTTGDVSLDKEPFTIARDEETTASSRTSLATDASAPAEPDGVNNSDGALGETPSAVKSGQWQLGAQIGSGSYGSVYKALDKTTGRIFAVKINGCDDKDARYRNILQDEINIYKDLRHPHIVAYLGHESNGGSLHIFLEYVAGGAMSSLLHEFGALDDILLRTSTLGLLQGLHYLHTQTVPVVHRDIKSSNILVDLKFCVKLADFGCSKRASDTRSFSTVGSIPWMAPEVIMQQDGHGRKADVWSMGCTIIEMASAAKPWGNEMFENIMYAMQRIGMSDSVPPIPDRLSEDGCNLVGLCVQRNPENRPWTSDLLKHPFVRGIAKATHVAQKWKRTTKGRIVAWL